MILAEPARAARRWPVKELALHFTANACDYAGADHLAALQLARHRAQERITQIGKSSGLAAAKTASNSESERRSGGMGEGPGLRIARAIAQYRCLIIGLGPRLSAGGGLFSSRGAAPPTRRSSNDAYSSLSRKPDIEPTSRMTSAHPASMSSQTVLKDAWTFCRRGLLFARGRLVISGRSRNWHRFARPIQASRILMEHSRSSLPASCTSAEHLAAVRHALSARIHQVSLVWDRIGHPPNMHGPQPTKIHGRQRLSVRAAT